MAKNTVRHILVLATAGLAILGFIGVMLYRRAPPSRPVSLKAEGHPLIGRPDARVSLLLVEDFRCPACLFFMEEIFPSIQKTYIDTGIANCIFVPVALFEGSQELANAALTVYRIAPSRFLFYVRELYEQFSRREGWTTADLVSLAERIGEIDLNRLETCIEMVCFSSQIDQNFEWAKKVMGNDFGVPALYINGIPVSIASFDVISNRIKTNMHPQNNL